MDFSEYHVPAEYTYDGMVMGGHMFPKVALDKIKHFPFESGDVLLASYPKCGSTWAQELLYLIHNNGDTGKAKQRVIGDHVRFLDRGKPGEELEVEKAMQDPSPRLLKTHMPAHFFKEELCKSTPNVKVLLVIRNPKDALVSYFNFYKNNAGYGKFGGSWNDFFSLYKEKRLVGGDYFDFYEGWLNISKHLRNTVLILRYEDMKLDLKSCIRCIAQFVNKTVSEETVANIAEYTSFKSMRSNPMANPSAFIPSTSFYRKGIVGDWKNYFSIEQSKFVEEQTKGPDKYAVYT